MGYGQIYNTTWWGNALDTARTAGTEPDFFGSQMKLLTSNQPELVTNGDFATDSDWILENGAVINNDSVNIIGVGSRFRQDVLIVGKSYRLNYQVVSTNGLAFRFQDGVTAFTDINQTVGYHIYYFKATGDRVQFQAVGDIDARIDNVSVKEVRLDLDQIEAKKCLADWIHVTALQDLNN